MATGDAQLLRPLGCCSCHLASGNPVALWFLGVSGQTECGGSHEKAALHLSVPLSVKWVVS